MGCGQTQISSILGLFTDLAVTADQVAAHVTHPYPPLSVRLLFLASQPAVTIKVSLGNRLRLATRGAPPGPTWS